MGRTICGEVLLMCHRTTWVWTEAERTGLGPSVLVRVLLLVWLVNPLPSLPCSYLFMVNAAVTGWHEV